jgi:RNA polymerase sigma-70 factor (ECF subfamily)
LTERAQRAGSIVAGAGAKPLDLRALFEAHYASMWRLLRRLGVREAHLDDAAQEVFWVAARRLGDIEAGREHAFLYGVALRVAAGETRKQAAHSPMTSLEQLPAVADERASPEAELADRQARALLDVALDRMPAELRAVFVLFELEGLEVRQIAEIEDIPVGTASSRLRRAREEFSAIAKRIRAALLPRRGDW